MSTITSLPERPRRRGGWSVLRVAFLLMCASILVLGVTLLGQRLTADGAAAPADGGRGERAIPPAAAVPGGPQQQATAIVRAWDAQRAQAWRTGDVEAVQALYVAGAEEGRRDVEALSRWVAAGWSVQDLAPSTRVLDVQECSKRRCVVDVDERLSGAMAVRGGERVALPEAGPQRRRITYERREAGEGWQVASARPLGSSAQG